MMNFYGCLMIGNRKILSSNGEGNCPEISAEPPNAAGTRIMQMPVTGNLKEMRWPFKPKNA